MLISPQAHRQHLIYWLRNKLTQIYNTQDDQAQQISLRCSQKTEQRETRCRRSWLVVPVFRWPLHFTRQSMGKRRRSPAHPCRKLLKILCNQTLSWQLLKNPSSFHIPRKYTCIHINKHRTIILISFCKTLYYELNCTTIPVILPGYVVVRNTSMYCDSTNF